LFQSVAHRAITNIMFFRARNLAVYAVLCAAIIPTGCSQPTSVQAELKETPAAAPAPVAAAPKLAPRRDADDTARFMAGLPGKPESPYLELEASPEWKDHAKRLDVAWARANKVLLSGLDEFQKQELSDPVIQNAPVFYPFSGPDALLVTYAFPHSPVYVLVGLEPPGTLPTEAQIEKQIEKKKMTEYLGEVRETVASILGRSFFITKQMDAQFRGQVTDGLLMPILELLVRSHYSIESFRYVRLDADGQVVERELKSPGSNRGVEIEYTSDADHSQHTMYYFTLNLADERLKENKAFQTYIAGLKGFSTAFKATSYMTHHREFSVIRELVLNNANTIVQDDSGMPFKYLTPDTWKVQLYGKYTQPFGVFKYWAEPDLAKAYQDASVKPLPFRIGYGYSVIPSNELVARRVHPLTASVAGPEPAAAVTATK
jgi:hypothetical protein